MKCNFFLKIRTTTTLKLSQNDRMYKISALRERRTHYTEATQKRKEQKINREISLEKRATSARTCRMLTIN